MKIKKIILLIFTIILFTAFSINVEAAKIHQEAVEVSTTDGPRNVVKVYVNSLIDANTNKVGQSRDMMLTIIDDNGNTIIAYCVDFGVSPGMNSWVSPTEVNATAVTLDEFLQEKITNESYRQELIQKLRYIYYFGYSSTRNTPEYYLATQALIWQTLSDYNFYTSADVKNMDDLFPAEIRNAYTATKDNFKISNIRFQKYPFPPSQYNYNTKDIDYNAADIIDISSEKNAINASITNYSKKPNFGLTNFGSLKVGETKTLTDSNKVLSNYEVKTCSNATCVINGNNLVITAGQTTGNINITLQRKEEGLSIDSKVYRATSSSQGIAYIGGKLPTITMSLTGSTVEIIPDEACYLCGTDYSWTNNPSSSCIKQEGIEEEKYCKKSEEACYICGTGDDATYSWTGNPLAGCTLNSEITAKDDCIKPPKTSGMKIAYIIMICLFAISVGAVYFYSEKKLKDYSAK